MGTVTLNNGLKMPLVGYGVFRVPEGEDLAEAVKTAIAKGYRSIDTAQVYRNEESVGRGIRAAIEEGLVTREELFITSKVWNDGLSYEETLAAYDSSLEKIGLDYLDLYLVHWPGIDTNYVEVYKALEKIYQDGRVRSIGVSNFHVHHLEKLLKETKVIPVINQIEFHPHLTQEEVRAYCTDKDIQVEAWSPLMNGALLEEALIQELASKYDKTPAQIVLRYDVQHNVVTIPKTMTATRMVENLDVFDFTLTDGEMAQLDALNDGLRCGPDPEKFNFK
ncbi:aldo/keto reductase [Lysinibacillus fusiformis]|jgi:diketogulonate reductase-like aldo/keto reductase|uniref:aldo/keto reductase n=1 Tax=Lysinibacillus TaxID=400634 RepID=UPI0004D47667|nr:MULTISPECIES: aldo/keto reductase [Lysinibacillus]AJK89853.1 glyoxal reductase [Lysinibacillus fusiformis]KAB0440876.1 aldo/keto reductase [Lysinibacillus fusiformis]KEK13209.1 glyoxal reductase [Lysinibacillus sphaericus]KGA80149.1 glyoxal reductase [Lysinibacillus fusiformis]KHK50976.1 glyoxal reductase [Lysinibacillus sp. A1]